MFSISKMRGRIHLAQLPDGRQVPAVATYRSLLFASIAGSQVQGLGRSAAAQGGDEAGRADAACSGKSMGLSLFLD